MPAFPEVYQATHRSHSALLKLQLIAGLLAE